MSKVKRAILVVLDGVGAGANPDAHDYGDDGASSLGHCAQAIGGLALPNLGSMGVIFPRPMLPNLGNITPMLGTPPTDNARVLMAIWRRQEQAKTAQQATGR
jgi:phosphopentomutase